MTGARARGTRSPAPVRPQMAGPIQGHWTFTPYLPMAACTPLPQMPQPWQMPQLLQMPTATARPTMPVTPATLPAMVTTPPTATPVLHVASGAKKGITERAYSIIEYRAMLVDMFVFGTRAKKAAEEAGYPSAEVSLRRYSKAIKRVHAPPIT